MLDILANNDWKRPIYFTGGITTIPSTFGWKITYNDGLVYKLVPIKTMVSKENHMNWEELTQILCTTLLKGEWNSESPDIYHDPETRKIVSHLGETCID